MRKNWGGKRTSFFFHNPLGRRMSCFSSSSVDSEMTDEANLPSAELATGGEEGTCWLDNLIVLFAKYTGLLSASNARTGSSKCHSKCFNTIKRSLSQEFQLVDWKLRFFLRYLVIPFYHRASGSIVLCQACK